MKCPNPSFSGMNQVTKEVIEASIKNYFPEKKRAVFNKVTTLDALIDFCIEDYRAWGDAVLMGAGAYLKIGQFPKEIVDAKAYIKKMVFDYLKGKPFSAVNEYDEWHKDICCTLSNNEKYFGNYSAFRKKSTDKFKNKSGFTVGNAQKFLNMLMKDLYACLTQKPSLLDRFEEYFEYCHMPLDSHILRFVDDVRHRENLNRGKRTYTWGNLNIYSSYKEEQTDIRKYVSKANSQATVLQTEFVVWDLYKG